MKISHPQRRMSLKLKKMAPSEEDHDRDRTKISNKSKISRNNQTMKEFTLTSSKLTKIVFLTQPSTRKLLILSTMKAVKTLTILTH